jgi:hypothetical protein
MADAAQAVALAVRRGGRLFNLHRYMRAQEVWEEAWRAADGDDRAFLEGLVQLAAGLHLRTRRGATRGAVHLLAQSIVLLDDYRPARHGVDVERLLADVDAFVAWMRELRRPHRLRDALRLPRIVFGR